MDNKRQSYFCCHLHCKLLADPANLFRENQTKPPEVFFSFLLFGNFYRKWLSWHKSVEFFEEIIFRYLEDSAFSVITTFFNKNRYVQRGRCDTLRELYGENNCDIVIVSHNLTNKFQPLDLSVNKAAMSFIQNKYNNWHADQMSTQLQNGTNPANVNSLNAKNCHHIETS